MMMMTGVNFAVAAAIAFVLFLGLILWSFPLAAIQAFAKAEYLAQIPGMKWVFEYFHGGTFTSLVNVSSAGLFSLSNPIESILILVPGRFF